MSVWFVIPPSGNYSRDNASGEEEAECDITRVEEPEVDHKPYPSPPPSECGAEISEETLTGMATCVRCRYILDPSHVYVCAEEHYTCLNCFNPGSEEDEKKAEVTVKSCCELRLLSKMPFHRTQFIKALLDNTTFRCLNFEKGCNEMRVGTQEIYEHHKSCQFTVTFKCRHDECTEDAFYLLKDLLEHYKNDHDGCVLLVAPGSGVSLPINFNETIKQRLCAILKIKGKHYVFSCEVKDDVLYVWIWALEDKATGVGGKTDIWYRLRFKRVRKLPETESAEGIHIHNFKSRCLFHSVEPSTITEAGDANPYSLDLATFKTAFVQQTVGGGGKWAVTIWVKHI